MDLGSLHDFVAVATHLHFRKAAEEREMDQSALSRSIKRLETSLGTILFERTSRRVTLTQAGSALLEDASQILQQADQAERRVRRLSHGDGHALRVGFVAPASFNILPKAIQHFDVRYGHIDVNLQELTSNSGPEQLRLGELDLCLIVRLKNDREGLESLNSKILTRQTMLAAVPSNWPIAQQESLSLADLAHRPMLLFPKERATRLHQAILMACQNAGFKADIVHEVWQLIAILSFVANGMGAAILVQAAQALPMAGVTFMKLIDLPEYLEVDILAVWSEKYRRPSLDYFIYSLETVS